MQKLETAEQALADMTVEKDGVLLSFTAARSSFETELSSLQAQLDTANAALQARDSISVTV